mgnify:FL=1
MSDLNNNKKIKLPSYIYTPLFLYQDNRLEKAATIIASFFYSIATSGNQITASVEYLCLLAQIHKRQYYKIMNQLEEYKYIKRSGFTNNTKIHWIYNPNSSLTVIELNTSAPKDTSDKSLNTSALEDTKLVHSSTLNLCTPVHTYNKEDIKEDITTTTGQCQKPVVVKASPFKNQKNQLTNSEIYKLSDAFNKNPVNTEFICSLDDYLSAALYSLLNREEGFTRQQRLHGIIKLVKNGDFEQPPLWAKEQRKIRDKKIGDERKQQIENNMQHNARKELKTTGRLKATEATTGLLKALTGKDNFRQEQQQELERQKRIKASIEKKLNSTNSYRKCRLPEELRASDANTGTLQKNIV